MTQPFVKVIESGSFDFGMPVVRLVDVYSRGVDKSWMQKRASVFNDKMASLRPEPGYSFIHLISMGAQEYFGCNRNGDGFNEKSANFKLFCPKPGTPEIIKLAGGLKQFHPTFEKSAHVFKHHRNQDPKFKIGDVKMAAYNDEMHRGELIIRVPHNHEWNDDLQKLASGKDIPFSMACKVAYDICTGCGNKARSRSEYCDHLLRNMTDITKSGEQYFAINDCPGFFDISKVIKPADRIAWSLSKVASAGSATMGGAELAEYLGVTAPAHALFEGSPAGYEQKMAAAHKFAAIEKLIEGVAKGGENKHLISQLAGACPTQELSAPELSTLHSVKIGEALTALGDSQICLSVRDFFKLAMGSEYDSISGHVPAVEGMLPGLYGRLLASGEMNECACDRKYDSADTSISRRVREGVAKLASDHSLASEPATWRASRAIVREQRPVLVTATHEKSAAVSKQAALLAKEFAKYQLSFAKVACNDDVTTRLTVLRNFVKV